MRENADTCAPDTIDLPLARRKRRPPRFIIRNGTCYALRYVKVRPLFLLESFLRERVDFSYPAGFTPLEEIRVEWVRWSHAAGLPTVAMHCRSQFARCFQTAVCEVTNGRTRLTGLDASHMDPRKPDVRAAYALEILVAGVRLCDVDDRTVQK